MRPRMRASSDSLDLSRAMSRPDHARVDFNEKHSVDSRVRRDVDALVRVRRARTSAVRPRARTGGRSPTGTDSFLSHTPRNEKSPRARERPTTTTRARKGRRVSQSRSTDVRAVPPSSSSSSGDGRRTTARASFCSPSRASIATPVASSLRARRTHRRRGIAQFTRATTSSTLAGLAPVEREWADIGVMMIGGWGPARARTRERVRERER